jgi:DNA-binding transcriptional ArsR family regulator
MTEDAVERCAEIFKAMGDRTRLSILQTLFTGERCVTDLAKTLQMDAPRISFHLTRLKFAGLVIDERRGQRVAYRLNPAVCTANGGGTRIDLGQCIVNFGMERAEK